MWLYFFDFVETSVLNAYFCPRLRHLTRIAVGLPRGRAVIFKRGGRVRQSYIVSLSQRAGEKRLPETNVRSEYIVRAAALTLALSKNTHTKNTGNFREGDKKAALTLALIPEKISGVYSPL